MESHIYQYFRNMVQVGVAVATVINAGGEEAGKVLQDKHAIHQERINKEAGEVMRKFAKLEEQTKQMNEEQTMNLLNQKKIQLTGGTPKQFSQHTRIQITIQA